MTWKDDNTSFARQYDPVPGSKVGNRYPNAHTSTPLSGGTVLIAGGDQLGEALLYDPAAGTFSPAENMSGCKVTPFVIRSADQFRSDPPPSLTGNQYARDYDEVKDAAAPNSTERPPDRSDVARFYAAVSPIQTWNMFARQIGTARRSSLPENARALALLNMAVIDAGIAVIETKYHCHF